MPLPAVPGTLDAMSTPMTGPLELDGLTRRYGPVLALDGLSFTVPAGQVVGFLGPNRA